MGIPSGRLGIGVRDRGGDGSTAIFPSPFVQHVR